MPFDGFNLAERACGAFDPPMAPRATIDFEARSPLSVVDVGSWRYAEHPLTEVLCLCFRLPYWPEGRVDVWHPAFPEFGIEAKPFPQELFLWIAQGGLVEAHNAQMERAVWQRICVEKWGWPAVPGSSWRCSAAKACAFALPRSLEEVAIVLDCKNQKDEDGNKVMRRLMKPRKVLKKEQKQYLAQGMSQEEINALVLYHFSVAEFERLVLYCQRDVLAEEEVSWHLRDLTPTELRVFQLDGDMNERGVFCDLEGVDAALDIVRQVTGGMTAELPELTDNQVERASQRQRLKDWVNAQGVPLLDTQAVTVETLLNSPYRTLPPKVRRVLEICREVNRSSTAKYVAMAERICRDSRLRGMMIYHGASTGRWTGAGVQPHNFPRGEITSNIAMEIAWEAILTRDLEWLEFLYGDNSTMETLSHATRGALCAPPGYELFVADFAAIEARVVFWLADQKNALEVFYRGEDIYCDLASRIFGRKITKADKDERQLGKQAILGLGFGMGAPKFVETCAKYGITITIAFAKEVVETYRSIYSKVKSLWYAQEAAAIKAVQTRRTVQCGKISWRVVGRFLHARLPSGRMLSYADPAVVMAPPPWDGPDRPVLTFMAVDSYTRAWTRQDTYGGTLVENLVQAIARDLLAEAMLRVEASGVYTNAFSVHDELVTYAPSGTAGTAGTLAFIDLVTETPEWAEGCPVNAEPWVGHRYRKG